MMSTQRTFRKFPGEWGYLQAMTSINFFPVMGFLDQIIEHGVVQRSPTPEPWNGTGLWPARSQVFNRR